MTERNKVFTIGIANKHIRCSFQFRETASFFDGYIEATEYSNDNVVMIDDYDKELWHSTGNVLSPHGEYSLLCGGISDYLLKENCCLVHGVAFRYKNRAYLIIGPSGIGKSTQIKSLMDIFHNQFSIICGDRPCLSFEPNGQVIVYPTPWNGKENWYGAEACELKEIFCLTRGDSTSISKLDNVNAVIPVFSSLISRRENEEDIKLLGVYSEHIISHYQVYKYVNGGIPESTSIFYDTISIEELEDEI